MYELTEELTIIVCNPHKSVYNSIVEFEFDTVQSDSTS